MADREHDQVCPAQLECVMCSINIRLMWEVGRGRKVSLRPTRAARDESDNNRISHLVL